ncbi:unnamed protein product [Brassica oleracea var. botrytis]
MATLRVESQLLFCRDISVCLSVFYGLQYQLQKMTACRSELKVVVATNINPKKVGGENNNIITLDLLLLDNHMRL